MLKRKNYSSQHLVELLSKAAKISTSTSGIMSNRENNEVYNAIKAIEGVRSAEYEYREIETFSEHEAKIMENGLILHGKFFKKVSD